MQTADINEQLIIEKFWSCLWESLNKTDFFQGNFISEFDIEDYAIEVHGYCYAHVDKEKATYDTPEWNDVTRRIELHSVQIFEESKSFDFNINLLENDKK